MYRRILALVLALLVVGAPQALGACRFVCAASMAESAAEGNDEYSCAHQSDAAALTVLEAIPHRCGHAVELPDAAPQAVRIVTPPAIVSTSFTTLLSLRTEAVFSRAQRQISPGPVFLATTLRI